MSCTEVALGPVTLRLTEGWTAPLEFQLKAGTPPTPLVLTGLTVQLVLKDKDGTTIDTTGDVTVVDPLTGTVRYTPDPTDLTSTMSPLTARWKVTDAGGAVAYWPAGPADRWLVYAQ